jgi:hypothetical protein
MRSLLVGVVYAYSMPQTKVVARGNLKIAVFTVTAGGGGG